MAESTGPFTRADDDARAHYLSAGMTDAQYELWASTVALMETLRAGGFTRLSVPLEGLVHLVDQLVLRCEELRRELEFSRGEPTA